MLRQYLSAILDVWLSQFGGWAAVTLSILGYLAYNGDNVPAWIFWLAAGVCAARTTFIVWRDEKQRVLDLVTPRLQILVERHPSFIQNEANGSGRLVRVGIKNVSGRSIKNVEADIIEIEPTDLGDYIPFTLQNTHFNYGRLDPGGVRMVDFIYKGQGNHKMIFHPKKPLEPVGTIQTSCTVTVWAHGKNCEAKRRLKIVPDGNFVAVLDAPE
jgi:hypothetical protein